MISFDIGLFAASFGNDFFENRPHCLGNLLRYDLFSFLIRKCFQQSTVIFPHFHPKMRRDLMAAIDQGTHRCRQTDRRDLKGLSKRDRCQFHRTDILFLMHDRPCLSRKIDPSLFEQTELLKIPVKSICPQPLSHFNKNRIAGIHDPLHKRLTSMTGRFMAAYPPVIDNPKSGTAESIFRCYNALFQSCRCRYDLKCRTRLIRVVDAAISPHFVSFILNFLL